jgi:2-amino-4-hydroxy-6-hydroxymethyldihydropteridine diphosphokinase
MKRRQSPCIASKGRHRSRSLQGLIQQLLKVTTMALLLSSVISTMPQRSFLQRGLHWTLMSQYGNRCVPKNHRHPLWLNHLRGGAKSSFSSTTTNLDNTTNAASSMLQQQQQQKNRVKHRVILAVGSNLGDRFQNIHTALQLLTQHDHSRLLSTSFLYQTAPMYVTEQPVFWNGAVALETELEPLQLLHEIKEIEASLGRNLQGIRNGPRPVDLDILFYQTRNHNNEWTDLVIHHEEKGRDLVIPHPRLQERDFVLLPLIDVVGQDFHHPVLNTTLGDVWDQHLSSSSQDPSAIRVLPLSRGRAIFFNQTICMGILNVTPDSFSDGGIWSSSVDQAVSHALDMERKGAGIIDVGGESSQPGAQEVAVEEEIQRTVPVIRGIRKSTYHVTEYLTQTPTLFFHKHSHISCKLYDRVGYSHFY